MHLSEKSKEACQKQKAQSKGKEEASETFTAGMLELPDQGFKTTMINIVKTQWVH